MPNKKTGLGRGFDSLIPTDVIQAEFDPTAQADREVSRTKRLLIQDIIPDEEQPRRVFNDEALHDLVESIKIHGVVQPIVVVHDEASGKFKIVAGERRWRAAKTIGLEALPAIVRTLDAQQRLEIALIENLQREDLNPLETATAFLKLSEQFNIAHEEIAKRVGKAAPTVSNTMRLLRLPDPAKRALAGGRISEGHARAILALQGDEKKQQELLDYILRFGWTVRKAEQFVTAIKEGATSKADAAKRTLAETTETKLISKRLKTPVRIQNMAKGGRLIIDFKSQAELKRITDQLAQDK